MGCSSRSSTRTGWKVPAPTCRVTWAEATPWAASRCQHLRVEVQSGGGGRHRPQAAGVKGLVTLQVRHLVRTLDVGGQGHVAVPLHEGGKVRVQGPQMEEFALPTQAFQGIARLQPQPSPGLGRLAGTDMGQDLVRPQQALHQDLQAPAALLAAEKPGAHDAGIVEDQQVARPQQVRERGEQPVLQPAARAVQTEEPAGPAPRQGPLGDEFRRQIKVKVRAFHGADDTGNPGRIGRSRQAPAGEGPSRGRTRPHFALAPPAGKAILAPCL